MQISRVGFTLITIGLTLLSGCSLSRLMVSVTLLRESPVVVANATPGVGQIMVTDVYEQDEITFVPPTHRDAAVQTLDLDRAVRPLGVFIVVAPRSTIPAARH